MGSVCAPVAALAQTQNKTRPRQATVHTPQTPQTPPASSSPAAAEAVITLNEQFLNALLDAMFTRLGAPSFPLAQASDERPGVSPPTLARSVAPTNQCASVVVLEREMNGVKTAVRFEQGRIVAPLAFTGSYSVLLLGCMRFQGWADTVINLDFDSVVVLEREMNGVKTAVRFEQGRIVAPLAFTGSYSVLLLGCMRP